MVFYELVPKINLSVLKKAKNMGITQFLQEFRNDLTDFQINYIKKNLIKSSEEVLRWLEKNPKHSFFNIFSDKYPILLREIDNPPKFLFAIGNIELLLCIKCSIVGSRSPSLSSIKSTKKIASLLSLNKVCVVSGMALGIDAFAHIASIKHSGSTIAVLPCGVDVIYPKINTQLYENIQQEGLLISEFLLGETVRKQNFLIRNRIVTGLSKATVIIEAKEKSGTFSSAMHALSQNRDVFVMPFGFEEANFSGNIKLMKEGAFVIGSAKDVLKEILNLNNLQGNSKIYKNFDNFFKLENICLDDFFFSLLISRTIHKGYGYVFNF